MGRKHTQETKDKIRASLKKYYIEHPEACNIHYENIKNVQTKEARAKSKVGVQKFWDNHPERKRELGNQIKQRFIDHPEKVLRGERSPSWRGGIQFAPYSKEFTHEGREAIRDRDNHKCRVCLLDEILFRRSLCVHHIDYNKQNCSDRNLISLCDKCHTATNANRKYWQKVLVQIQSRRL